MRSEWPLQNLFGPIKGESKFLPRPRPNVVLLVQVAKLCNNLALAIKIAAVAEVLAFGQTLGIGLQVLSGVFNTSFARCGSRYYKLPVFLLAVSLFFNSTSV